MVWWMGGDGNKWVESQITTKPTKNPLPHKTPKNLQKIHQKTHQNPPKNPPKTSKTHQKTLQKPPKSVKRHHLIHDYGAVDGEFEVGEGAVNGVEDLTHPVQLLPEEDVQGLQRTQNRHPSFDLWVVIDGGRLIWLGRIEEGGED